MLFHEGGNQQRVITASLSLVNVSVYVGKVCLQCVFKKGERKKSPKFAIPPDVDVDGHIPVFHLHFPWMRFFRRKWCCRGNVAMEIIG